MCSWPSSPRHPRWGSGCALARAASRDQVNPNLGSNGPGDSPGSRPWTALTAADLGASLGLRATLVQFSTEFCTYCGPTRELLAEVAAERPGVAVVEIDAADRMDLARRLRVMSTPTVLVLGPDGVIERRSSGQQRKSALLAAVGAVLGEDAGS